MKKLFTLITAFSMGVSAFAGGLLTNTNQSVHFLRNPAQDASTDIDAAYSNPAGLIYLPDGFHFSLTNQSAFQTRTVTSTFAPFAAYGGNATKVYNAKTEALLIPSFQAAYKKDKLALSASFAIIGGGGEATFSNGLPSFEAPVSMIPMGLTAAGVRTTNYSMEQYLNGKQFIFGFQVNGTYKFNEIISGSVGVRINYLTGSYDGYLRNIQINPQHPSLNPSGNMMPANTFFTNAAAAANGASASLDPVVTAGYGTYTMSQLVSAGVLTSAQVSALGAGLGKNVSDYTATQVQGGYKAAAGSYTANAAKTADKEVDCKQTGWGITPILGLDIHPIDNLLIGLKYEFGTKLNVTNNTRVDNTGLYPDGEVNRNDIPALLTIGAQYTLDKVKISGGYHYFYDTDAKLPKDRQNTINSGLNEYLLGAEYSINKTFLVSAGGQLTRTGVTDDYQKDMSYSLNSVSIGFGGAVNLTKQLRLNVAYFFTKYDKWTKAVDKNKVYDPATNTKGYNGTSLGGTDVYDRTNNVIGVGLDYNF
jgi:long-chain fatty acid transport protein